MIVEKEGGSLGLRRSCHCHNFQLSGNATEGSLRHCRNSDIKGYTKRFPGIRKDEHASDNQKSGFWYFLRS